MFREYKAPAACFIAAAILILTAFSGVPTPNNISAAGSGQAEGESDVQLSEAVPLGDGPFGGADRFSGWKRSYLTADKAFLDQPEASPQEAHTVEYTGFLGGTFSSVYKIEKYTAAPVTTIKNNHPPVMTAPGYGTTEAPVTVSDEDEPDSEVTEDTDVPANTTAQVTTSSTQPVTTASQTSVATTTTTAATTTTAETTTTTTAATTAVPSANQALIDQVFDLVNQIRAQHGLPPFKRFVFLDAVADRRAMEISSYYSHSRPDGKKFSTIYAEFGLEYHYAGENIAAGYPTAQEVVDAWMASTQGHRENILSTKYTYMGVGYSYKANDPERYNYYWTQEFYTPF